MDLKIINNNFGLERVRKIIAVAAGKGGVGKSTMAVTLAHALKALGVSVGLLDADFYGPSLARMLPFDGDIFEENDFLIPVISKGIPYMSMGLFGDEGVANAVRAPIVNAMVEKFLHKVRWPSLDVLIVDLPPGTGDIPLTLMQSVKLFGAVVVTTPQKVSVIDVKKCIEMFHRMKVDCLGVIENMSYYVDSLTRQKHRLFSEGGGRALAKEFSIPFLGEVPLDPVMCEKLDVGESIFESPSSSGSQEILWQIGIVLREKICDNTVLDKTFLGIERIGESMVEVAFYGGSHRRFSLSTLQAACPCARCVDEVTGRRVVDLELLDPNVRVGKIEKIGNYGLRFEFSSGCRQGIYTCAHLEGL